MLERAVSRDPLAFHFLAVARHPFVVAGFVDSGEVAALKVLVPHCTVYDSLAFLGDGSSKEDHVAALARLLDGEEEDPVDGQKLCVVLAQATGDDIDLVHGRLGKAWVATTVSASAEALAKRLDVPVYDVKTAAWVNVDPGTFDVAWARSVLATAASDPARARLDIKGAYHEATVLANELLNGGDPAAVARLLAGPNGPVLPGMVLAYLGIEVPVPDPPAALEPAVDHPPLVNRDPSPPVDVAFQPEYQFITKNAVLKRLVVRLLDQAGVPKGTCTAPAARYAWLRRDGAWKQGIPEPALRAGIASLVGQPANRDDVDAALAQLPAALGAFSLASRELVASIVREVTPPVPAPANAGSKHEGNPVVERPAPGEPRATRTVAGRGTPVAPGIKGAVPSWVPLPPVPNDPAKLVAWIGDATGHVAAFAGQAERAIYKDVPFTAYEPAGPPPLDGSMEQVLCWMNEALAGIARCARVASVHLPPRGDP